MTQKSNSNFYKLDKYFISYIVLSTSFNILNIIKLYLTTKQPLLYIHYKIRDCSSGSKNTQKKKDNTNIKI